VNVFGDNETGSLCFVQENGLARFAVTIFVHKGRVIESLLLGSEAKFFVGRAGAGAISLRGRRTNTALKSARLTCWPILLANVSFGSRHPAMERCGAYFAALEHSPPPPDLPTEGGRRLRVVNK
jgi:hypothetical protein